MDSGGPAAKGRAAELRMRRATSTRRSGNSVAPCDLCVINGYMFSLLRSRRELEHAEKV